MKKETKGKTCALYQDTDVSTNLVPFLENYAEHAIFNEDEPFVVDLEKIRKAEKLVLFESLKIHIN